MSALELLFDYFEDHVRAAAAINERRPLAFGVLCFLVGGVSFFIAQALTDRLHLLTLSWASCAFVVGWELLLGFIFAAVVHLILEMGDVRGSAASTFVLFGLADLAWALTIPLILIIRLGSHSAWAVTLVFFATWVLSLSLKARGLQDNYRIGQGRAWLTLSLPYMAVCVVALLVFSFALLSLIMHFAKSFS